MRLPRPVRYALIVVASLTFVYLAAALTMMFLPDPKFASELEFSPEDLAASNINFEQVYPFEEVYFSARDGARLFACRFPTESDLSIVLVHGVTADSTLFNNGAGLLREATGQRARRRSPSTFAVMGARRASGGTSATAGSTRTTWRTSSPTSVTKNRTAA